MKRTAISGAAAVAAALAVVLSGCGSDTKTEPSTSASASKTTSTTSAKAAPSSKPKVAPRDADATGPNPTITSYIKEAPVKRGDPGSPTIDLPVPDGWEPAGADTPDWAYGAIYVLQLNADGLENQGEIVGAAKDVIDSQTTITP